MKILGIDIGGSGIKGAPVDTEAGILLAPRYRIPTPIPAKPKPVAGVVGEICQYFEWDGPIGAGFPAVVQQGITKTAANVHPKWINTNAAKLITKTTGHPTTVLNDADAAGLAEMRFGAGKNRKGVVLIVTIGTGLGTSLFSNGCLMPNTELGHIELNGQDAELGASDAARKRNKLSWSEWGLRFNDYLQALEKLIWPDLIILGGGASKKFGKFSRYLQVNAEVVPAQLRNEAGIVGAAIAAERTGS
jgi:polyphosphate glucokinase